MKTSAIGWTDFSGGDLNFVTGCTPVSEGCKNCYARAIYDRFGRDFSVTIHEDKLSRLLNAPFLDYSPKRGLSHKPMAFVCDTGDLFHEAVPDWFLYRAFAIMAMNQRQEYQVLTKRPARMLAYITDLVKHQDDKSLPKNIWLGVTCENQRAADERIPLLLETPAAVRFVSVEPMLGPVDLTQIDMDCILAAFKWEDRRVDWVICGAESGPNRRPFDVAWAIDLYTQCQEAGVPFFYKQGSGLRPGMNDELPGIGQVKEWPR